MSNRLIALTIVLVGFSALTAVALMNGGYLGILEPHFQSWGGAQVIVDLAIVALLACIWMARDARDRGLSAWPFVVITLFAGSFGPLLYLVTRELRASNEHSASASVSAAV
jgi:hypothetical protein